MLTMTTFQTSIPMESVENVTSDIPWLNSSMSLFILDFSLQKITLL